MSLHFTHFLKLCELDTGLARVPSTKYNLRLVDKAIVIARLQEPKPFPSNTEDTISRPG